MARDKYVGTSELNGILRSEIAALLAENNSYEVADFDLPKTGNPYVILVVGVNGVGKTTTIGKLAHQFKAAGKSVVLGLPTLSVPLPSTSFRSGPTALVFRL